METELLRELHEMKADTFELMEQINYLKKQLELATYWKNEYKNRLTEVANECKSAAELARVHTEDL